MRLNGDTVSMTKIMSADICVHLQRGMVVYPSPLDSLYNVKVLVNCLGVTIMLIQNTR